MNVSRAFADDNIVGYIDGNTINISPLLSGSYSVTSSAYSASGAQFVQTVTHITSSVKYHFVSESITTVSSQSLSLAKLRIINLDTVTGEIYRVKTSNKSAASQLDFSLLADTPTVVDELLVSKSIVVNQREIPIGTFNNSNVISNNWYSNIVSDPISPDVFYLNYTSGSNNFVLYKNDNHILDAVYALTTASSYFFGTKNTFSVFPLSEYTLAFDAYVCSTSASFAFTGSNSTTDVYVIGSSVVNPNPLGQKIGTISTTNDVAYFENQQFNFQVPITGSIGVRFVASNGFWEFANISLKVAEEFAFSPDEVTLTIPNTTKVNDAVIYKADFFDINNNALGIAAISLPTYFTGSPSLVSAQTSSTAVSASYAVTASYALNASGGTTNTGSFTGSFKGDGSGLINLPSSSINIDT